MSFVEDARPVGVVTDLDLAEGIPSLSAPRAGVTAFVLVRFFTEPVGVVTATLGSDGMSAAELARTIVRDLESALRAKYDAAGLAWTGDIPLDGLTPAQPPEFVRSRDDVLRRGLEMTVAICTHNRPESLRYTLESLTTQQYDRLSVLVVDNAPSDDRSRMVASAAASKLDLRYVVEPRPGLSWARNRAIEQTHSEIIAWVDDDEECDRWWATEIARAFVEVPEAEAVTGAVVPSELETPSQMWFEEHGGVRRGRGFQRMVFSPDTRREQSPLYPRPPFGKGANMAFRRSALDRIGRFDCALGAGTVTRTAEDTAAFSALLLDGGTIVYQPSAIVHHRHRRDGDVLTDLMRGHGRGLGAFYMSMLMRRPGCAAEVLRLAPMAMRDMFSRSGTTRTENQNASLPAELRRAHRLGLVESPFVYAKARARARRLRRKPIG